MEQSLWEPWIDPCPICRRRFDNRHYCPHTQKEATRRIIADWEHALLTGDFSHVQFIPRDFTP